MNIGMYDMPGMAGMTLALDDIGVGLVDHMNGMAGKKRRAKRRRQRQIRKKRKATGGPSTKALRKRTKAKRKTARVVRKTKRKAANVRAKAIKKEQRVVRKTTRKVARKGRKTERKQSRETRRATRRIGRAEVRGPAADAAEQSDLLAQAAAIPEGGLPADPSGANALATTGEPSGPPEWVIPAVAVVGILGVAWYMKQQKKKNATTRTRRSA